MAVFYDKVVPVPKVKGITINRADGDRVLFVKEAPYDAKAGYARPKRTTIGYVTDHDSTQMHPTNGYKSIFPKEWEKLFGEKVPMGFKYIGMFAITDAVNSLIGIKDIMDQSFGRDNSDAMIDFAMYSMLFQTSVTEHFSTKMSDQCLFSDTCLSDLFYSDLFGNRISYAQILDFKKRWAQQCKQDGVDGVWICIDGSNDDCESTGVVIAEEGHAESLSNRKIVSFTYAVTEDGKPVAFNAYRGGLGDAKAIQGMLSFLKEVDIQVKGVILERGYCGSSTLKYLNNEKIPYVILVKSAPIGYTIAVNKYGNQIKLNAEHFVRGTTLFGVQDTVQLFGDDEHDNYLTLFYDFKNGGDRITALLNKLNAEIVRCEKAIAQGKIPIVAPHFQGVLSLSANAKKINVVAEKLQAQLDKKGLYSIVSSCKMDPADIHHLVQCRNSSEAEYMIVKTQLGYGKMRVHATKSVHSRFAIGFIASCIRYELQSAAKELNRSTAEVIKDMSHLYMTKVGENYIPMQGISEEQELVLKALNSSQELLAQIAKDENERISGRKPVSRHRKFGPEQQKAVNIERETAEKTEKKEKKDEKRSSQVSGQEKESKQSIKTRRKPGVKSGTKRSATNKDGSVRKAPGVPKGTKRSAFNKDGSPRQKPGPKPKETQQTG